VVEQIERLAEEFEVHVYSARVQDLDLTKIVWHKTGINVAPHVLAYCWFLISNQVRRKLDKWLHNLNYDIVFSPGINCFDADVIAVHIVFAEFYRLATQDLQLLRNKVAFWPRLIHRHLIYHLFIALERIVYSNHSLPLIVISHKMEADLNRSFSRTGNTKLLYHGIDPAHMNPERRQMLRDGSRNKLGLPADAFALLIVGNDWRKKGLYTLLDAVVALDDPNVWVLVRGDDDRMSSRDAINRVELKGRVKFLPSIPEIDSYYAACDAYVGPSLEDSFAIPPLEAMACGVPVIVSAQAGVSELIVHNDNGLILRDSADSTTLSGLIRTLRQDANLRERISSRAAITAGEFTWDRNGKAFVQFVSDLLQNKERNSATTEMHSKVIRN
jgi:UDP-glucose:(heptosyl)LPS alpha-1,3-glucosyltransferase